MTPENGWFPFSLGQPSSRTNHVANPPFGAVVHRTAKFWYLPWARPTSLALQVPVDPRDNERACVDVRAPHFCLKKGSQKPSLTEQNPENHVQAVPCLRLGSPQAEQMAFGPKSRTSVAPLNKSTSNSAIPEVASLDVPVARFKAHSW